MGSLLLLSLPLLLVAAYPVGASARRRHGEMPQSPSPSSPARFGASVPFWVRLRPELVAVAPGRSVWLNCSTGCPLPANPSLFTQLQRGSPLALERPRSVILEPPVLSGGRYTLRCHVTHVFPVGFLMVTLRHGGRIIYFESLERFKDLDPANVTLTYTFRARTSDLRQPVTCHARLTLDGLVVRSSSAPVILTALDWSPESKVLASASIAAFLGILLAVGATFLRRCLAMGPAGLCSAG
ncbi:intercellular adhesion molecule 4 [Fukomys damarensis]|uniref:intercellular adhesion molecule 4 n=1 Tax=Fukomys damarensis TaxID=885580 RepID=UPI00053FEDA1|nr:intercellular adhesion molecule 4 [Fukomys damarensis]